ncbi:hypothetical protein [Microbispora sp. NPDC046933]|uniref:hypothetical protein n=1 Tax=Microbispora sp. NPDC046933 TaxID=3155618 RepID=UPI0033EE57F0
MRTFVSTVYVARVFNGLLHDYRGSEEPTFAEDLSAVVGPLSTTAEQSVRVERISMNSPLTLELLTTGVGGAGAVSAVVYLFKNPDKIGEWFPKLQTSWYNGRAEAEKARKAYEKLRKARTEMRELQS